MNILEKLFKKKVEEEKQESWFNDSEHYANGMTDAPLEGAASVMPTILNIPSPSIRRKNKIRIKRKRIGSSRNASSFSVCRRVFLLIFIKEKELLLIFKNPLTKRSRACIIKEPKLLL